MKTPELRNVDVDMVPLIDIISLLLMFLIVVGGSAASTSNVQMKLPRASEAKSERAWPVSTVGRIVIQMKKNETGKYQAVIENAKYETGSDAAMSLKDYLDRRLDSTVANADRPVKLRIPESCPMQEVEKVVSTIASIGLVHVHYAAEPDKTN
jgi:biopolymer transport protein ExbD